MQSYQGRIRLICTAITRQKLIAYQPIRLSGWLLAYQANQEPGDSVADQGDTEPQIRLIAGLGSG